MGWSHLRDLWRQAAAAVADAEHFGQWQGLSKHPTVIAALAQIDASERAIASVAEELSAKHSNEPEEV